MNSPVGKKKFDMLSKEGGLGLMLTLYIPKHP